MKKLIFGNVFINSPQKLELTEMWLQLNRHINPDCDLLLVETPASEDLSKAMPSLRGISRQFVNNVSMVSPLVPGVNWTCFTDNIGHLSLNGKDGWSRAFTYGIHCALENNYDYVAHVEGDVLCRLMFDDVIARMTRHNLGAISTITTKWNFMEIGLIYMNCNYLREINFLDRYNWQTDTKDERSKRPENLIPEVLKPRLLYELWRGGRDENDSENGLFVEEEFKDLYFLTHAKRHWYYHRFMQIHAPELNWRHLFPF